MPTECTGPLRPIPTTEWSRARRACVGVGALLIIAGILDITIPPRLGATRMELVDPFNPAAADAHWQINAATSVRAGETIIAIGPDRDALITSPPQDFSADFGASPSILLSGLPASPEITFEFYWRRSHDPKAYSVSRNGRSLSPAPGGVQLQLEDMPLNPAWTGRIASLSWRIRSRTPAEFTIRGISAPAERVSQTLAQQWWWTEPVGPSAINSIRPPHVMGFSPVTLAMTMAILIVALHVGVAVLRRRPIHVIRIAFVVGAAWLAVDARILFGQARLLEGDTKAGEPGNPAGWPDMVWRMVDWLKDADVPDGAIYAVVGGNLPDAAGDTRLRYLLAPQYTQINVDPLQPRVDPGRADYFLVLDRRAAQYDSATRNLTMLGLTAVRTEVVVDVSDGPLILRRVSP